MWDGTNASESRDGGLMADSVNFSADNQTVVILEPADLGFGEISESVITILKPKFFVHCVFSLYW